MIKFLEYPEQEKKIVDRLSRPLALDESVLQSVEEIIDAVRSRGDAALLDFTRKFDGIELKRASQLVVHYKNLKKAWDTLPSDVKNALTKAAQRIEAFHKKQLMSGWIMEEKSGIRLEQRCRPIESVGVYIPGGLAAYPSSVLMNVIPAQIAGVRRIVMVTPPSKEGVTAIVLAAAHLLGIKEVYRVGGAQAVAALAFGTKTIPRVDKVVGPGNVYVASAKRLLYGVIDIDMFAGPSEIMIVAESTSDLRIVVADLLSQAEHDPNAVSIAVFIGGVDRTRFKKELQRQVLSAPRREIIEQSLSSNGMIISVPNRDAAVQLVNMKAPEHLELMVRNPQTLAKKIKNAGAIFLGNYTPETIGDYIAGPNHTLPTGGTARFFSPLSVLDFMKTSHVVEFSKEAFEQLGGVAELLAEQERLFAHAYAIKIRRLIDQKEK